MIKNHHLQQQTFLRLPHLLLLRGTRKLSAGRLWYIKIGIAACFLSILAHTPFYEHLSEVAHNWGIKTKAWQILHPLTPLNLDQFAEPSAPYYEGTRSHLDKIGLRLTIPFLGHYLNLGTYTYIVLSHLAGLAFFTVFPLTINRQTRSKTRACLLSLALSVTPFGSHFFTDQSFGDGVAWLFLLLATVFQQPFLVIISVVAACFTDERAAISIPLAILATHIQNVSLSQLNLKHLVLSKKTWILVFGFVFYLILRIILSHCYHLNTGSSMLLTIEIVISNYISSPMNMLSVFEGGWCLILAACLALCTKASWQYAALTMLAFTLVTGAAFAVWDFTRSFGYIFLMISLSARAIQNLSFRQRLWVCSLCFWVSLLWYSPENIIYRLFTYMV